MFLTTYPIGTFAGFEISKHFIIRAGVLGGLTITTYNDGVDGRALLVHLVSANTSVLNEDGRSIVVLFLL
jgi:hypothetical protein